MTPKIKVRSAGLLTYKRKYNAILLDNGKLFGIIYYRLANKRNERSS